MSQVRARVLAMHVCACYGRAERTVAHHAVRLLCFTPADVRGRDHKWSPCCHRIRLQTAGAAAEYEEGLDHKVKGICPLHLHWHI